MVKKRRYSLKDSHQLNRNCIDQPQYNKIYEAIDASEINIDLQLPKIIIKEISHCSMGTLIPCFKKKCNEKIAWLPSERRFGQSVMVKCPNKDCNTELYPWFCKFCNNDCTIMEEIVYCDDCQTPSCYLCVSKWVTNEYITHYKCDKCF